MKLRELINDRLNKVRTQPNMPAGLADEYATELSAMLSSLSDAEAELRGKAYSIMVELIKGDKPIGFAEAVMKSSEQYAEYKKAEGMYKSVLEVIRSLRAKVRMAEEQFKENIG